MIDFRDKKEIIKIIKFGIVGCINTLVTAIVIFVMMKIFSCDYKISNVWGYIIGVINSFVWNKLWVFQSRKTNVWKEMFLFGIAFLVAYGAQFSFLLVCVEHWDMNEYLATFLGLFIYGGINFVMNRVLTFTSVEK